MGICSYRCSNWNFKQKNIYISAMVVKKVMLSDLLSLILIIFNCPGVALMLTRNWSGSISAKCCSLLSPGSMTLAPTNLAQLSVSAKLMPWMLCTRTYWRPFFHPFPILAAISRWLKSSSSSCPSHLLLLRPLCPRSLQKPSPHCSLAHCSLIDIDPSSLKLLFSVFQFWSKPKKLYVRFLLNFWMYLSLCNLCWTKLINKQHY